MRKCRKYKKKSFLIRLMRQVSGFVSTIATGSICMDNRRGAEFRFRSVTNPHTHGGVMRIMQKDLPCPVLTSLIGAVIVLVFKLIMLIYAN